MTYFTLSSPFLHYLLPDSSVCFILKTGGAENSVHACRRRYAPSRTDQNARKNGIFVHCPYINKGVVHFSRLVVLLWCLSTGETKTPWKKWRIFLEISAKTMDSILYRNYVYCYYPHVCLKVENYPALLTVSSMVFFVSPVDKHHRRTTRREKCTTPYYIRQCNKTPVLSGRFGLCVTAHSDDGTHGR